MKTVFEGKIINVISVENGLIIAYAYEQNENNTVIAYKMVTFEDGKLTNVPKSLYHVSKFGTNYAEIEKLISSPISCKSVILPNDKIFVMEPEDGSAKLFLSDGELLWSDNLAYRGQTPSSVAINNRSVWACFKESGVLIRMNIINMKEELRIGGGSASPFNMPVDMFADDDFIYVCCAQDNNIIKLNLNTYVTEVYAEFDSPLLQFIKNGAYEFAVLAGGVYLIN